MNECELKNEKGKTIAMGSCDQMLRYLKHHVGDGMYAIEGPTIDMTFYRKEGVVYPASGTWDGQRMPPRNLDECVKCLTKTAKRTVNDATWRN